MHSAGSVLLLPLALGLCLSGCLIEDEMPVARDWSVDKAVSRDMGTLDQPVVDLGPFVLELTCKDGSKPDLSAMPSCKTFVDRVLDECCPSPKPALNKLLSDLMCDANADLLCQAVLDSRASFQDSCSDFENGPGCS